MAKKISLNLSDAVIVLSLIIIGGVAAEYLFGGLNISVAGIVAAIQLILVYSTQRRK